MQWSKTKSILILVLVAVNIFLYGIISSANAQKLGMSERYIEDAVAALLKSGITISEETVPTSRIGLPLIEVSQSEMLYPFARNVLGDDRLRPVLENEGVLFENNVGRFIIMGDVEFVFTPTDAQKGKIAFESALEETDFAELFLKEQTEFVSSYVLFGAEVLGFSVVEQEGAFSGRLLDPIALTPQYVDLIDPVNALMEFKEYVEEGEVGGYTVDSIEEVYRYEQEGLFESAQVVPTYLIKTNRGDFTVSALSGDLRVYVN